MVPLNNFSCIIRDFFHVAINSQSHSQSESFPIKRINDSWSWCCRHPSWSRQHQLEVLSPQRWAGEERKIEWWLSIFLSSPAHLCGDKTSSWCCLLQLGCRQHQLQESLIRLIGKDSDWECDWLLIATWKKSLMMHEKLLSGTISGPYLII